MGNYDLEDFEGEWRKSTFSERLEKWGSYVYQVAKDNHLANRTCKCGHHASKHTKVRTSSIGGEIIVCNQCGCTNPQYENR